MGKLFDDMSETSGKLLKAIDFRCPKCSYDKLDDHHYSHNLQDDVIECPQCHSKITIGSRNNDRMMMVLIVIVPFTFAIALFLRTIF